jgi:hypothetical protein
MISVDYDDFGLDFNQEKFKELEKITTEQFLNDPSMYVLISEKIIEFTTTQSLWKNVMFKLYGDAPIDFARLNRMNQISKWFERDNNLYR